jgi:hypothetical protein
LNFSASFRAAANFEGGEVWKGWFRARRVLCEHLDLKGINFFSSLFCFSEFLLGFDSFLLSGFYDL